MIDSYVQVLAKFEYPRTLLSEYNNWYVLLRSPQTTLGSLIILSKERVKRFSEISPSAGSELHQVVRQVEHALMSAFDYSRINYLMLMMVDQVVHFHVIPRYASTKTAVGVTFSDHSWPAPPDLKQSTPVSQDGMDGLASLLKAELQMDPPAIATKKYGLVYTTGVFDVFHQGHLNILEASKALSSYLLVGVSTDELVLKEKTKLPLIPFRERCRILESIVHVDEVIPQLDKNKQAVVDKYGVEAITVGSDWRGRYPEVSCDVVYIDYTPLISSSRIRDHILGQIRWG